MNQCIQGDGGGLYVENNHTEDYRNVLLSIRYFTENTADGEGAGVHIKSTKVHIH